jgi:hypothetical protein
VGGAGGLGAIVTREFSLTKDDLVSILVGGMGGNGISSGRVDIFGTGGGGGGGTFVADHGNVVLAAAGGGGGADAGAAGEAGGGISTLNWTRSRIFPRHLGGGRLGDDYPRFHAACGSDPGCG